MQYSVFYRFEGQGAVAHSYGVYAPSVPAVGEVVALVNKISGVEKQYAGQVVSISRRINIETRKTIILVKLEIPE